jgi:hypothetical protein
MVRNTGRRNSDIFIAIEHYIDERAEVMTIEIAISIIGGETLICFKTTWNMDTSCGGQYTHIPTHPHIPYTSDCLVGV